MAPRTIMFIRHGEKPTDEARGIDRFGNQDDADLIVRGWQRAGALIHLFAGPRADDLPVPTALFAASPSSDHPSKRSKHTLVPLANYLGVRLDLSWGRGQEAELADSLRGQSGVVLVAWEHHAIAGIVRDVTDGRLSPDDWPNRFDLVWVVTQAPNWDLKVVPQHLLRGDADA